SCYLRARFLLCLLCTRSSSDLRSLPTRRSSDLGGKRRNIFMDYVERVLAELKAKNPGEPEFHQAATEILNGLRPVVAKHPKYERSEEHTSELQSRFDLVCRLLLEKKKQD